MDEVPGLQFSLALSSVLIVHATMLFAWLMCRLLSQTHPTRYWFALTYMLASRMALLVRVACISAGKNGSNMIAFATRQQLFFVLCTVGISTNLLDVGDL